MSWSWRLGSTLTNYVSLFHHSFVQTNMPVHVINTGIDVRFGRYPVWKTSMFFCLQKTSQDPSSWRWENTFLKRTRQLRSSCSLWATVISITYTILQLFKTVWNILSLGPEYGPVPYFDNTKCKPSIACFTMAHGHQCITQKTFLETLLAAMAAEPAGVHCPFSTWSYSPSNVLSPWGSQVFVQKPTRMHSKYFW